MRSFRDFSKTSNAYLAAEARKRPEIARAMAEIGSMSEDEVLAVPVSLPWVRKALLALHREHAEAARIAQVSALVDAHMIVAEPALTPLTGEIVRYDGPDDFLTIGTSPISIRPGKLLYLTDDGGIWYETAYGDHVPEAVRAHCVSLGRGTRADYVERYKAALLAAHPIIDQIIDLTPEDVRNSPRGRLAGLGVRIG